MTDIDPFADVPPSMTGPSMDESGVLREQRSWKRPLIVPRGGTKAVPYTRASSLADYAANTRAIQTWQMRYLARGLGQREDLAALAGVETYNTGWDKDDNPDNQESGRRLDSIIVRALDTARIHEKADMGTAGHTASNPGYEGHVPSRVRDGVADWRRTCRGLTILDTEVFLANDELKSAGTVDHVIDGADLDPDECFGIDLSRHVVALDKKFGQWKARSFEIQLFVYADGELHGRGADWGQRWTYAERYGKPCSTEVAIIAHIPFEGAQAHLVPIDLRHGRIGAELAARNRDWQRGGERKAAPMNPTALVRRKCEQLITQTTSRDAMNTLHATFADVWTPSMTSLATQRLALTSQ